MNPHKTPDGITWSCTVSGDDGAHLTPMLRFPDGGVQPGFDVGTLTHGVDKAVVWPEDLNVKQVD
jgi:hypothetical protein